MHQQHFASDDSLAAVLSTIASLSPARLDLTSKSVTTKMTQQPVLRSRRLSPIGVVDPVVRALQTVMYGMAVHFGTLWTIGLDADIGDATQGHGRHDDGACANRGLSVCLSTIVLLHEYWVYLQHTNVLANPYCQWLDRQYGIALLKSNQHWAIAGTLYRLTKLAHLCWPPTLTPFTTL